MFIFCEIDIVGSRSLLRRMSSVELMAKANGTKSKLMIPMDRRTLAKPMWEIKEPPISGPVTLDACQY